MTARMLFLEACLLVLVAVGVAIGVAWERGREGGTRNLRWQRDRLRHDLHRARSSAAMAAIHVHTPRPRRSLAAMDGVRR